VRGSRRRRAAHVIRQQGQELDNVEWKEVKNRDGPDPRSTNLRLCRRAGLSAAASMNGYWANSLDRSPGCTGNSKTRWAVRRQVPTPSEDLGLLEGGRLELTVQIVGNSRSRVHPAISGCGAQRCGNRHGRGRLQTGGTDAEVPASKSRLAPQANDGECGKRPLTTASVEPRLMHSGRGDRR